MCICMRKDKINRSTQTHTQTRSHEQLVYPVPNSAPGERERERETGCPRGEEEWEPKLGLAPYKEKEKQTK